MPYPYRTIRDWLAEEEAKGNVLRITQPIKCGDYDNLVDIGYADNNAAPDPDGEMLGVMPETEMRAVTSFLHTQPGMPIGIIEQPVNNRPDIPVVTNIWPTLDKVLAGMDMTSKEELVAEMARFETDRIKPNVMRAAEAPCKEVIIRGDDIDLRRDIAKVWVEFNKLCFSGCNGTIIAYDPARNTHGLTKTRLGLFDWDNGDPNQPFSEEKQKRYGFATMARPGRPGQGNTGRYYFDNFRDQGKSWPAAFVYGLTADYHVVGGLKRVRWPEMGDEYEILGGMRGEAVDVVESETIPGMMVPAHAEWVIEGEFVNEDYRTPPCSEDLFAGFIWGEALWPVFKVNCITHRTNPLWTGATFSSLSSQDHAGVHQGLYKICTQSDAIYNLRQAGYRIKDVATLAMWAVVVQLEVDGRDKPTPEYGLEIGKLVGAKYTIVVGPDINPYDAEDVLWAVGMRAPRNLWYDYPPPPPGVPEIPRYGIFNEVTTDMGYTVIDATIQAPGGFHTFPPRTEPPVWERDAIERIQAKLSGVLEALAR